MGNGTDVKDPEVKIIVSENPGWGRSAEKVETEGICDTCERYSESPSSCYLARAGKINGLYILGKDFVFLRCPAYNYAGESLYRPIKLE
ncbi:MAG: hypothetical protein J7K54_01150 [Candidatus Aenigmarchaeota archaeon]|nr:hypothetical protein [Candidatus Aenigmarchaeota archaeon]